MKHNIIAHRRLRFTVLQQIFAKGKGLHSFLKDEELNNQKNVFFFPTEENAQGTNGEERIAAYMLTIEGRMRIIKEKDGKFFFVPSYNEGLLDEAVEILREEVDYNGRSCFYQTLKEIESVVSVNIQPLF